MVASFSFSSTHASQNGNTGTFPNTKNIIIFALHDDGVTWDTESQATLLNLEFDTSHGGIERSNKFISTSCLAITDMYIAALLSGEFGRRTVIYRNKGGTGSLANWHPEPMQNIHHYEASAMWFDGKFLVVGSPSEPAVSIFQLLSTQWLQIAQLGKATKNYDENNLLDGFLVTNRHNQLVRKQPAFPGTSENVNMIFFGTSVTMSPSHMWLVVGCNGKAVASSGSPAPTKFSGKIYIFKNGEDSHTLALANPMPCPLTGNKCLEDDFSEYDTGFGETIAMTDSMIVTSIHRPEPFIYVWGKHSDNTWDTLVRYTLPVADAPMIRFTLTNHFLLGAAGNDNGVVDSNGAVDVPKTMYMWKIHQACTNDCTLTQPCASHKKCVLTNTVTVNAEQQPYCFVTSGNCQCKSGFEGNACEYRSGGWCGDGFWNIGEECDTPDLRPKLPPCLPIGPVNGQQRCLGGLRKIVDDWISGSTSAKNAIIKQYGHISHWNMQDVESLYGLFVAPGSDNYHNFNADISKWDVSRVTDLRFAFQAKAFNSDLSKWDVSNVININAAFNTAEKFNRDLSKWVVSKVRSFSSAFLEAVIFNSDLSKWDVSRGTSFSNTFKSARVFNSDLSRWQVGKAATFSGMFEEAYAFNSDLSRWSTRVAW